MLSTLNTTKVDVTCRDLETTKQKSNEPFSLFLMRWREKAAQMINRPTEQEQVDIIIKNLLPVYQNQLQTQYLLTFQSLIMTASKFKDLIQLGQLKEEMASSSRYKKPNQNASNKDNEVPRSRSAIPFGFLRSC